MKTLAQSAAVLVAIVGFLLGSSLPAAAASEFDHKVQLTVQCKDEKVKAEVASFIQRELRSLKDVAIVDEGGRHEIDIMVVEIRTRGEVTAGYGVSVLVTSRFPAKEYFKLPIFHLTEADRVKVEQGTKDLVTIELQHLLSCAKEDLRKVCEQTVVSIDMKVLEPARRAGRVLDGIRKDVEEYMKKLRSSPTE